MEEEAKLITPLACFRPINASFPWVLPVMSGCTFHHPRLLEVGWAVMAGLVDDHRLGLGKMCLGLDSSR